MGNFVNDKLQEIVDEPRTMADGQRLFFKRELEERTYVATTYDGSVAAGDSITLALSNPPDSGVTLLTRSLLSSTLYPARAQVHDEFTTGPSGGTTVEIDNLVMDTNAEADDGNATASAGVTFDSANTHSQEVYGGGSGGQQIGDKGTGVPAIMEPGRKIVIESENLGSATDPAALTAVYAEIDGLVSE
jgi:hypothetical protein